MSETVEFQFALGQVVLLPTDNEGVVVAQTHKGNVCTYEVIWWSESKRQDEWLREHELRAKEDRKP